jgi:hypothetical protein
VDTPTPKGETPHTLFSLQLEPKGELAMRVDAGLTAALAVVVLVVLLARFAPWRRLKAFEIETTEFNFGPGKVTLRPSYADLQVAYQIWVELSTRKIGLPIEVDDDVINQIYDSWYAFFGVTRDLIKAIPVERVADKSTRTIVDLSIAVLNEGLRPHLTRWQARYRAWLEQQLKQPAAAGMALQDLQKTFPKHDELMADMLAVNAKLIAYREAMRGLVYGDQPRP